MDVSEHVSEAYKVCLAEAIKDMVGTGNMLLEYLTFVPFDEIDIAGPRMGHVPQIVMEMRRVAKNLEERAQVFEQLRLRKEA